MQKRALLDVDGVVADFVGHVIALTGSPITREDVLEWDIFSILGPLKKEGLALMEDPHFWETLPLIEGAVQGVGKLAKTHELFWVTSPWPTCKGWDVARRGWLKKHFDVDPKHVVITSSKFLCTGDMFIDDHVDNVRDWVKYHPAGRALLFDAPYNQGGAYERFKW